MCRRSYVYLFIGFLVGLLALGLGGYLGAQRLMVVERESPLDFDGTIQAISAAAEYNEYNEWKVPKVYRLCKSLEKEGLKVRPVAVIELCKPDYAAELLSNDDTRLVSSFMPCRISVYEKAGGIVVVSHMNTRLVSRLFGGKIAEVMAIATQETQVILDQALTTANPQEINS
ncbi:MAG: DUF302 domain-containing protein [Gammaproteobacteria bacterium]|nr:DUF302 domain-containing protein [Gammaproteobacteria bacterium]